MHIDQMLEDLKNQIIQAFVSETTLDQFANMKLGARTVAPVAAKAPKAAKPARNSQGKRFRRTSEELSEDIESVVKAVKETGKAGISSEELRKNLQWEKTRYQATIAAAVADGMVRRVGEKRASRLLAK